MPRVDRMISFFDLRSLVVLLLLLPLDVLLVVSAIIHALAQEIGFRDSIRIT